jgi:serine/threonine protein kinase
VEFGFGRSIPISSNPAIHTPNPTFPTPAPTPPVPKPRPCRQVYLICELVTGGELLEAVIRRGYYSEAEARLCFQQLLRGIDYLHSRCAPSARMCGFGARAERVRSRSPNQC